MSDLSDRDAERREHWSDERLSRAASQGDADAFSVFCVRSLPTLHRFIRSKCQAIGVSLGLVEDLAQETVLRALSHARKSPGLSFSVSWLRKIAQNLVIDQARKLGREKVDPSSELDAVAAE